MTKTIKIGLLGIGTVGTGVVRVLQQNADLIRRRLGASIEIRRIVPVDACRQDLGLEDRRGERRAL